MTRSSSQVAAIKRSIAKGSVLAECHPEIADEWRQGATSIDLAERYLPHLSETAGEKSVCYAISILIPKEERMSILKLRQQNYGRKCGIEAKRRRVGIFGMSKEKRREVGRKAVRASLTARLRNLGVASYDDAKNKKQTEYGKMTEREYIKKLSLLKADGEIEYTWKLIALHVNAIFGNKRSPSGVSKILARDSA